MEEKQIIRWLPPHSLNSLHSPVRSDCRKDNKLWIIQLKDSCGIAGDCMTDKKYTMLSLCSTISIKKGGLITLNTCSVDILEALFIHFHTIYYANYSLPVLITPWMLIKVLETCIITWTQHKEQHKSPDQGGFHYNKQISLWMSSLINTDMTEHQFFATVFWKMIPIIYNLIARW